jgi:hypothetical protein
MNITRVIRNSVKFFTIAPTTKPKMSESALARLCRVSTSAVVPIRHRPSLTSKFQKSREPHPIKSVQFNLQKNEISPRGPASNIVPVRVSAWAKVIESYALYCKRKIEETIFNYRKFAELSITDWIQSMTGWRGSPIPTNGITTIEEISTECNTKVSFELVEKESTKSQNKTVSKQNEKIPTQKCNL